jgi:TolB-like protein
MRFAFGDHVFDIERRELRRGGEPVVLEPQVFDLLAYLVVNRDRVVSRDDLIAGVWDGRVVSDSAITTRLNAVRRAVGDSGAAQQVIRTIHRRGVRFVADVREMGPVADPAAAVISAAVSQPALALPDKPSIAVLPFQNMSGDPAQEYFADGMVEEIITALSRTRWLFVIARNSSFAYKGHAIDVKRVGRELGVRYLLEGSVRRSGERVRITVQLIDAETGAHLWADRFDGALDAIFELQDQVAVSVAGVIEPALEIAEGERSARRATADPTAYDLYLRALPLHLAFEASRIGEALRLLNRAIARDPRFGPALALAAWCHVQHETFGLAADVEANRSAGLDLARRALEVAGDDVSVLAPAAFALARFSTNMTDAAIGLVGRGLERNPSCARGWYVSGWLHLWDGQAEIAVRHFQTAARLNPRDQTPFATYGIGVALYCERRFAEAASHMVLALQQLPQFLSVHRWLAATYAQLGRIEEARRVVQELRALTPHVMPLTYFWRDAGYVALMHEGLRLAIGDVESCPTHRL